MDARFRTSKPSCPARIAVRCDGRELTYSELKKSADGISQELATAGVAKGDRVGLCLPKRVEAVAAIYGILKAGAANYSLLKLAACFISPSVFASAIGGDCGLPGEAL